MDRSEAVEVQGFYHASVELPYYLQAMDQTFHQRRHDLNLRRQDWGGLAVPACMAEVVAESDWLAGSRSRMVAGKHGLDMNIG
jgi:hypothetical protein